MATENELPVWRLSVIAELVWAVLPERERPKSWEDVAVAAVYEYERRMNDYQDGDTNFQIYSDAFINKQYIANRRSDIRKFLESDGRYIGFVAGRGSGEIFRITKDDQLGQLLSIRQNRMAGLIDSYNESLEVLRERKPALALDMLQFAPVKQLEVNGN